MKDDSNDAAVWTDLVQWVQSESKGSNSSSNSSGNGGYVHPSLSLRGSGPSRGVAAKDPIAKGELLIRISSEHVLSGATEATETGGASPAASPWLKCLGAFLKAKRDQSSKGSSKDSPKFGPYLNSLPSLKEYETLHNWSTQDEVQPFLKGTTLGTLVTLDRTTKGIQTRYRESVEPYLRKVGAIQEDDGSTNEEATMEQSPNYQAFLEASMCISTRGFHLLPTAAATTTPNEHADPSGTSNANRYDGPFLLPIIDLLNHDPKNACTTLKRHQCADGSACSYFAMVAERDIAKDEEIFHSYGSDLTSAQVLQTFGFVPQQHSTDALVAAASQPLRVSQSSTPVGLSNDNHLIAASRSIKASSFPDTIMDRIRAAKKNNFTERDANGEYEEDEYEDEDDCFWEVCDIPDRPKVASSDEFLVSASSPPNSEATPPESLLTEEIVTLLAAQFLPADAFDEIFPSGQTSNTVMLDRSILEEDYYLGMLVCKAVLVALFLRARDYCCDDNNNNTNGEETKTAAKAISGASPSGAVGKYISSLLEKEAARIQSLLETKTAATAKETTVARSEREIYGRTIRTEELTNLWAFCKEVESLMATLSLDGDGEERTAHNRHLDQDPPSKRAKVE